LVRRRLLEVRHRGAAAVPADRRAVRRARAPLRPRDRDGLQASMGRGDRGDRDARTRSLTCDNRRMQKLGCLCLVAAWGCGDNLTVDSHVDPGSLVKITMTSKVGVMLDEIENTSVSTPTTRDRVATALLAKDETFWKARATLQLRLTAERLVYRSLYYP